MPVETIVILLLLAISAAGAAWAWKRGKAGEKRSYVGITEKHSAVVPPKPVRADSTVCPRCGHELKETGRRKYDRCALFVYYQCPECGEKKVKHMEVKPQYSVRVFPIARPGRVDDPEDRRSGYGSSGYYDDEEEMEETRVTGTRIEHPHYSDDTDYECSVCGSRFDRESGTCPHCGAVFNSMEVDTEEYDEEEDEEDAWDEEDGL